jgi:hypothetical protein
MEPDIVQEYVDRLTDLARQLNSFASGLKNVRSEQKSKPSGIREDQAEYKITNFEDIPLFSKDELSWLNS